MNVEMFLNQYYHLLIGQFRQIGILPRIHLALTIHSMLLSVNLDIPLVPKRCDEF